MNEAVMNEALEDMARIAGKAMANKFFEKRGNGRNVEVHLSREELSMICAAAFHIGFEEATRKGKKE